MRIPGACCYSAITSPDGCVAHEHGNFDWSVPEMRCSSTTASQPERRFYTRRVGLLRWLRDTMEADDGYEPGADEVVMVGRVNLALSGLVVTALREAGIRAEVVERHSAYHGSIQAGIVCFATDREAAAAIIDRLLVTET